MNQFNVVGYEHIKGEKSRKTGKPYDFMVFHCIDQVPFTKSADFGGNKVEQISFNLMMCSVDTREKISSVDVGSLIKVYYGRTGYPEDLEVIIC